MRPSTMNPGEKFLLTCSDHQTRPAFFVQRRRAHNGSKAINVIRVPDFVGLNGPTDDGTCTMSDYDFARKSRSV